MKLICTQENLQKALSYLERVVGKQSTLPILSNFLLETENGRLKISATNLEIGVIVYIGAKIEQEGKIAIPAKLLMNFISNLPYSDVVELSTENFVIHITTPTHQMKIKGLNGKDFPIIPQYKKEYFFSFPAQKLKNALTRVLFCASINEARLELTGAHIFFFQDSIHLAATDSFRLAEEIIPFTEYGEGYLSFLQNTPSLILPLHTLQEISRVITPESNEVKIALEENQIFFEVDGVQIISRIINGKYPEYKQIIPQQFTLQIIFQKEIFQRAIKIASALSMYNENEITLSFDPRNSQCTVTSVSKEVGENVTTLPIEFFEGKTPLTITFNPRYVLEGINALGGEKILFLANTEATPAGMRMMKGEREPEQNYLYILMPIRK